MHLHAAEFKMNFLIVQYNQDTILAIFTFSLLLKDVLHIIWNSE